MDRLRQVPRSETDDPVVLGMYDLLFGKDVDPVTDQKMGTATGSEGDWWTTYALSPDIMEHAVAGFVMYRSPNRVVDGVVRELAQTRIGWCAGSKFVFSQHVQALRGLGADPAKIRDITAWQTSDAYTRAERAVLAYADAIALDAGRVSDELITLRSQDSRRSGVCGSGSFMVGIIAMRSMPAASIFAITRSASSIRGSKCA